MWEESGVPSRLLRRSSRRGAESRLGRSLPRSSVSRSESTSKRWLGYPGRTCCRLTAAPSLPNLITSILSFRAESVGGNLRLSTRRHPRRSSTGTRWAYLRKKGPRRFQDPDPHARIKRSGSAELCSLRFSQQLSHQPRRLREGLRFLVLQLAAQRLAQDLVHLAHAVKVAELGVAAHEAAGGLLVDRVMGQDALVELHGRRGVAAVHCQLRRPVRRIDKPSF